jgi:hypothetical protein
MLHSSFALLGALAGAVAGTSGVPAPRDLLDDGAFLTDAWTVNLPDRIAAGEFPDRRGRDVAPAADVRRGVATGSPGCVTSTQLFTFEDTDGVLTGDFSDGAALDLLYDAGEALIATHGDVYDFIGFWINYEPHHTIGRAFHATLANDVRGIGRPVFDFRSSTITNTERVRGIVMFWNVNDKGWVPGAGPDAHFTRIAMGHEFEHQWGLFLPPIEGLRLQGAGDCSTPGHWNFHVDNQASCMQLLEWYGADPARVLVTDEIPFEFNRDILGGLYSYTDLYVMGYVTPEEMDAGNSEFRYMNDWTCDGPGPYFGPITEFTSADVIAAAGPRIPDAASAPKHFRAAWCMIHLPGDPPDEVELDKAAAILNQATYDYMFSTLGRGSIDHTIFDDCNCNTVPDADDIASGTSADANEDGVPDECQTPCPADLSGDGVVDVNDLVLLFGGWGTSKSDVTGDGATDQLDLIALLTAWGPCG